MDRFDQGARCRSSQSGAGLFAGRQSTAVAESAAAMLLGFLAYGVSLALFVIGLRHLGTARTGAYFSTAPIIGTILALLIGEPLTPSPLIAGALMALGLWLHLTEHHAHAQRHEATEHDHEHTHDEHHQHQHAAIVAPGVTHKHLYRHETLQHIHSHFPDAHHGHGH